MEKALIFDIDGTLWDATEGIRNSLNSTLEALGSQKRLDEAKTRSIMGMRLYEIYDAVFENEAGDICRDDFVNLYPKMELEQVGGYPGKLFPFVKETLEELKKNFDLHIVSNCQKGYSDILVSTYHLEPFFALRLESGATKKNKAENIMSIKEKYKDGCCTYVGDLPNDFNAAKEAGVHFIHASYGFGEVPQAKVKIGEFREMLKVILQKQQA